MAGAWLAAAIAIGCASASSVAGTGREHLATARDVAVVAVGALYLIAVVIEILRVYYNVGP